MTDAAPSDSVPAFDTLMPNARFRELHTRIIDRPIEEVWPEVLSVQASDVRLLAPLFFLRGVPAMLKRKRPPTMAGDQPLLDVFVSEGFIVLQRDTSPVDGHAIVTFGAAGVFWSLAHNNPVPFASPQEFLDFDTPGYAKTVARLEAFADGGRTRVETETLVIGTDAASERKFAPYWAVIRGPSGLIRRSWLAGIERRSLA